MADQGWGQGRGQGWAAPGTDGGQGQGGPGYGPAPGQPGPPGQPAPPYGGPPGPDQPGWGQPGWGQPGPYGPLPPPGKRRGPSPVLLVLLAVGVFAAAIGLVAALVLTAGGESDDDDPAAEPVEVADVDLVPFDHPDGTYELSLPDGWVSVPLEGDLAGVGREAFPDDPELAEVFQQMAGVVPRAVLFVSVDPDDMAARRFVSNFNVVRVPGAPEMDREQLTAEARRGVQAFGGEPTGDGTFTTPAGEAVRIEYDIEGLPGVSGIQYHVQVGDELWGLSFTSDDLPADEGLADAVAATFAPGT